MENQEQKRSNKALLAVALLLGLSTVFFGYRFAREKANAEKYLAEQTEVNEQYELLTEEFDLLNEEYVALETENQKLSGELSARISELQAQKDKVNEMIRTGGKELREARALIAQLRTEKDELLARIETLTAENDALKVQNQELAMNLNEQKEKNAVLSRENVSLTKELVVVTEERDKLAPIANYGQVVHINDLEANAVRVKKNGKEKRANGKTADQLKLCFQLEENPVAELGDQDYFIRILTPEGTTIYEEQSGSGIFNSLDGDENGPIKYTAEAKVNFENERKNVCVYWGQTNPYPRGEYVAEIYHRGYKVGTENFKL